MNSKTNHPVRRNIRLLYLGLVFLAISIIAFVLILVLPDKNIQTADTKSSYTFQKQGTANFTDTTGKTLCSFDIEIAETPEKLTQGLMYRDSLAANQAMLFLMPRNEQQSFWMKNTYIPLDIIFINEDSTIVSAGENTVPFDERGVTSKGPAKFILEVNAGLYSRFGLKPGDRFFWSRNKLSRE